MAVEKRFNWMVKLRVSEGERAHIRAMAGRARVPVARFIRAACLGEELRPVGAVEVLREAVALRREVHDLVVKLSARPDDLAGRRLIEQARHVIGRMSAVLDRALREVR